MNIRSLALALLVIALLTAMLFFISINLQPSRLSKVDLVQLIISIILSLVSFLSSLKNVFDLFGDFSTNNQPGHSGITTVTAPKEGPLRIFICYAEEDKLKVTNLRKKLQTNEFKLEVYPVRRIAAGLDKDYKMKNVISSCHVVIVCLSQSSSGNMEYLQGSVRCALEIAKTQPKDINFVIPLLFDNCEVPYDDLRNRESVNYFEKGGHAKLVEALYYRANTISIKYSIKLTIKKTLHRLEEKYHLKLFFLKGLWLITKAKSTITLLMVLSILSASSLFPVTQLTHGLGINIQPSFSPDGEKIVFISYRDGNKEIYMMDANGRNEKRLTFTENVDEDLPSFTPDGTRIIFGGNNSHDEEIYLTQVATTRS